MAKSKPKRKPERKPPVGDQIESLRRAINVILRDLRRAEIAIAARKETDPEFRRRLGEHERALDEISKAVLRHEGVLKQAPLVSAAHNGVIFWAHSVTEGEWLRGRLKAADEADLGIKAAHARADKNEALMVEASKQLAAAAQQRDLLRQELAAVLAKANEGLVARVRRAWRSFRSKP